VAGQQQCIANGDEQGNIVLWNVLTGDVTLHQPLSTDGHVFCWTFSPRTEYIFAVGYKTGAVVLLDVAKKKPASLQRLRGHDDEIHCICWVPSLGQETDPEDECELIASSSRDKSIRLWNESEAQTVVTLRLPAGIM